MNSTAETLMLLEMKNKLLCEQSFYHFVRYYFRQMHNGNHLEDNWHIKYICNRLQALAERRIAGGLRDKHLIINVPPRSLKSIMVSVLFPVWIWTHNQHLKFISSSYSGDLSMEHNVAARRIVESQSYQNYWNIAIATDQNTKGKFENTKGGFRKCTSTGGTITGQGGNIIIIDDPCNPLQALSDVERRNANEHFDNTLSTRLNEPDKDVFIIIMQRLHEDDLTGHVLKENPTDWELINIPAETTNRIQPAALAENYVNGLMFPRRMSRQYLDFIKTTMGSYQYSCQFLQEAAPIGGGMIKRSYFRSVKTMNELPDDLIWNFTVDGAFTKDTKNCPTAILAYARWNNDMVVRNVRSQWKEFPEMLQYIVQFCANNGYTTKSRLYIEPKASGLPAVQSLKRYSQLNVIADVSPTTDKVSRVNGVLPFLEAGRCYLLQGDWNDGFIGQCTTFPNSTYNDEVDCLTMAINKIEGNYGTGLFSFGKV
jgi:predicted phage terminase large subunit-like protein